MKSYATILDIQRVRQTVDRGQTAYKQVTTEYSRRRTIYKQATNSSHQTADNIQAGYKQQPSYTRQQTILQQAEGNWRRTTYRQAPDSRLTLIYI